MRSKERANRQEALINRLLDQTVANHERFDEERVAWAEERARLLAVLLDKAEARLLLPQPTHKSPDPKAYEPPIEQIGL
jgi:hypothetical protein